MENNELQETLKVRLATPEEMREDALNARPRSLEEVQAQILALRGERERRLKQEAEEAAKRH